MSNFVTTMDTLLTFFIVIIFCLLVVGLIIVVFIITIMETLEWTTDNTFLLKIFKWALSSVFILFICSIGILVLHGIISILEPYLH